MSVYAFVQSPKNDGTDFLVKDGVLIENLDEAHKYLETIDTYFKQASNQNRPTYIKKNNQHIFVGFHNEKDVVNRKREFLLCWDSTDSKEIILETATKINLTDEFDYENLGKVKPKNYTFLFILFVVTVTTLYKIFKQ